MEAYRRSADGNVEAVACLQLTSGTMGGMPKLVMAPHRFFTWNMARLPWWMTPDGVYFMPRPTVLATRTIAEVFAVGGTMVLSVATRPETIEAEMVTCGATAIWTTPSVLHLLAELAHLPPADLALRYVRFGAAPLADEVARRIAARYHAPLINEFGSTEGGSLIGTPPGGAPVGSIGMPYTGVAVRIVNERGVDVPDGAIGELIAHTPALMRGYIADADATARAVRDGWLWTGDLARQDAAGFLYYEGRRALRINVGGFKVSPDEVEAVLLSHPAVREVVVTGMPDAARGEVVRAVIVPRGAQPTAGSYAASAARTWLATRYPAASSSETNCLVPRSAKCCGTCCEPIGDGHGHTTCEVQCAGVAHLGACRTAKTGREQHDGSNGNDGSLLRQMPREARDQGHERSDAGERPSRRPGCLPRLRHEIDAHAPEQEVI